MKAFAVYNTDNGFWSNGEMPLSHDWVGFRQRKLWTSKRDLRNHLGWFVVPPSWVVRELEVSYVDIKDYPAQLLMEKQQ